MIEGTCLVVSVYDNHYLAGAKHSTDTDGQGSLGTLFTSLSKKRELAMMVSVVNVFWRVRDERKNPAR